MSQGAKRDPIELQELMDDFQSWLERDPSGVVICGVLQRDATGPDVRVDVGMMDFDVRHHVLLAYTLLQQARERVVMTHDVDLIENFIPAITRAMNALGGQDTGH